MNLGAIFDRAVRAHAERIAIIDEGRELTYRDLGLASRKLANALLAAGFRKGDRAAMLLPNCAEAVIVDGALMQTGIVKVPLNARISAAEIRGMLRDCGVSVLFTHQALAGLAEESLAGCSNVQSVIAVDASRAAWTDFAGFLSGGDDAPVDAGLERDDVYALIYTSGTSGVLKAAMISHRNWHCLTRANLLRRGTDRSGSRVAAYVAPITHAAGGAMLANLLSGATNLMLRKFEPADFLRMVEAHRINDVLLVPTMINMLLDCPALGKHDLSSLDNITYGASPMAPERIRQALDAFGPILTQGYGQTESTAVGTTLSQEDHMAVNNPALQHRLASAGRPSIDVDLAIVDADGRPVPTGEIGEIVVRGDNVMLGYWNAPELTRETIRDGWLYSRDMGRMDEDGYLYLVDRKSDMIISGGFNVYPAEVENALYEHPAVLEAGVVSVPDPKWGETVKAVVVLRDGHAVSQEALIAHCRERLAHFKAPRSVDFVDELPKSGVGKILRRVIKARYWQDAERLVS